MSLDSSYSWVLLSGDLPPTLNTRSPATDLTPAETPSSYGIEPNRIGKLVNGTCPAGTAAVVKTYTIGGTDYEWHFNRVWRISGTQLIYGAPEYTTVYYPQGLGHLDFTEDGNSLLKMLPVGDSMIVFKTTGAYLIPNVSDHNATYTHGDIIQEASVATATHAVSIGGLAYASNAYGLFSVSPTGEVNEVTFPIRGSSTFKSVVLTADYNKKYLVGATDKSCYDILTKKTFDYNTSGFLYTSRSLRMTGRELQGNPFTVSRVAFEIEHTAEADGEIVFATQMDSRGWNDEQTIDAIYERETTERAQMDLDVQENCRAFRIKITSLSGLSIRRIFVNSSDFTQNSFAE